MNKENANDGIGNDIHQAFEGCTMPGAAQAKLNATVVSITQENASQAKTQTATVIPMKRHRRFRAPMVAAAAMAAVLAFGGAAWAGTNLLHIGNGQIPFFGNKSMVVYDSMENGSESMTAQVGQTQEANGATVTLDSVSCDRNVANVYLTISRDGGFSAESLQDEKGSNESEWSLLQGIVPALDYSVSEGGKALSAGSANILDAYLEKGKIKAMLRITPEAAIPESAEFTLSGNAQWNADGKRLANGAKAGNIDFSFNLDLSNVDAPRNLGAQKLYFNTNEGAKTLNIERFAVSKLACVMVTAAGNDAIDPATLQVVDNDGNTLVPAYAGDAKSNSVDFGADKTITEYAGASMDIVSVAFTPYTHAEDAGKSTDKNVDISKAGAKIAMSEYGGYTVEGRTVKDGVETVTLKPYGMVFDNRIELVLDDKVSTLNGKPGIVYDKVDYATGELTIVTSYYAASDEEIEAASTYKYSEDWNSYQPETSATQTATF